MLCRDEALYWTCPSTPVQPIGRTGLVMGWLFGRETSILSRQQAGETTAGTDAVISHLLKQCWGNYLAILAEDDAIRIMPDPSGLMPVFGLVTATHLLVASHVRLLFAATGSRPAIDFSALRDFMARPELRARPTCLAGVQELPPGHITCVRRGILSGTQAWHAVDCMPGEGTPSLDEAVTALRHESMAVMRAWHEVHGPPVVAVSGGVDSSLICGALAAAGLPFSCATLATSDPGGDERLAARQLADHLGVSLYEEIYQPADFDPFACASAGLPRPSRKSFLTRVDAMFGRARRSSGALRVWDGNGGDNLFCYLHSSAPVADRITAEGVISRWPATLVDMCKVTGGDLREMAQATISRLLRRATFPDWPADLRLMTGTATPFADLSPVTAWDHVTAGRHAGKHDHLALIMRAQLHLHGPAGPEGRFSPLMSQPILELCLSLPTWLWCHGGMNRAIARHAFAQELPTSIHYRTSKAGPDSFLRAIFARNRAIFRDLLIGGVLDQAGLLDIPAVDRALATGPDRPDPVIYRVLDLVEAENWARSWQA